MDRNRGVLSPYVYLEPNQVGFHYEAEVRTDSLGFRNREVRLEKPANLVRVVAIGDSHTFGHAVPDEQTWPRQLEARLRSLRPERPLEVINGGIDSLSIDQELQLFEDRLARLEPDVVLLAYYWNDMPILGSPMSPWPAERMRISVDDLYPDGGPAAGPRGPATPGGAVDALRGLAKRSYLLYFLFQKAPGLQMAVAPSDLTRWKRAILRGESSSRIEASWGFVRSQLERFERLGEQGGFAPFLVTIPIFEQMTGAEYGRRGYQQVVDRLAHEVGISSIDPLDRVRAIDPTYPRDFVPFDGHPTGRIYGAIAAAIADSLAERIDAIADRAPAPGK